MIAHSRSFECVKWYSETLFFYLSVKNSKLSLDFECQATPYEGIQDLRAFQYDIQPQRT